MRLRDRTPATLLVPGWSDDARALGRARDFLLGAGWPPSHVACVDFRDRYGSNIGHADEIAAAIETLARATGEEAVAVVAHSMGGLALRRYLGTAQCPFVHTAVFVGTPHRGTWAAWVAWGLGGNEMRPGSAFLRELSTLPLPASTRAICITTPIDTRVLPGSSALLDGVEHYRVRLPTHPRMLRHMPTLRLIRDLLVEGRA